MIRLSANPVVVENNQLLTEAEAKAKNIDLKVARDQTRAWQILSQHLVNKDADSSNLNLRFDLLASHDITYVGIIQTARASGLEKFPMPYILTNCHNSLCAVGGTINSDDHLFGLSAAEKYGGIFVPTNVAVIHQYVREMGAGSGKMILGSDSHTRYGALGTMGIGEGGPELVKQLLGRTYDIPRPEVVLVWLENEIMPGVGPQDVALALIGAVFKDGFVKNRVLEFAGPGLNKLSVEFRSGIDVMTTETTCLSSIWQTDDKVKSWYELHQRADAYADNSLKAPACYDRLVQIDLAKIKPMIALPFHPSNVYTIEELLANAQDILAKVRDEAIEQFGDLGKSFDLKRLIQSDGIYVDQGVIAGCAGGTYENCTLAAQILNGQNIGSGAFELSVYPASLPQSLALVKNGSVSELLLSGAIFKTAFCGPCFGAGDTPGHGTLSIRHATRNFPNREGSKPGNGQLSAVALMDARSIAATAANQGRLTPATSLNWQDLQKKINLQQDFDASIYAKRVYNGYNKANEQTALRIGPNIADWPAIQKLPKHLLLKVACVITDPVTTTDELIPSGETSSLRSNPYKLAEFTLSRKDPDYVARAKKIAEIEKQRQTKLEANIAEANQIADLQPCLTLLKDKLQLTAEDAIKFLAIGSTIVAPRPGDGSAREQAASCQKVLGGWANIANEYATKRYRSNLINWGMLPLLAENLEQFNLNDQILLPDIAEAIATKAVEITGFLIKEAGEVVPVKFGLGQLTENERKIILTGCLINFYRAEKN